MFQSQDRQREQSPTTPSLTEVNTRLTAHSFEDLEGHASNLLHAEWQELILSEKLKDTEAERLEHDADVAFMLEPVQHPHAGAVRRHDKSL